MSCKDFNLGLIKMYERDIYLDHVKAYKGGFYVGHAYGI